MDLLDEETEEQQTTQYTFATFKSTRIVNMQSVESVAHGELLFIIQHRFGSVNQGIYEFFGLDQATIRLGLEYGVTDRLTVGLGRSSFNKTYDGFFKYKIFRQSSGLKSFPMTVSWYSNASYQSLKVPEGRPDLTAEQRAVYVHQLLLARKISPGFSFQLNPTFLHRNLAPTNEQPNDLWALGAGGRLKISNRVSLNFEYCYQFNNPDKGNGYYDMVALGVDIETGGHVFSLHMTNSQGMTDRYFVGETTGDIADGGIFFGFNINRTFNLIR